MRFRASRGLRPSSCSPKGLGGMTARWRRPPRRALGRGAIRNGWGGSCARHNRALSNATAPRLKAGGRARMATKRALDCVVGRVLVRTYSWLSAARATCADEFRRITSQAADTRPPPKENTEVAVSLRGSRASSRDWQRGWLRRISDALEEKP